MARLLSRTFKSLKPHQTNRCRKTLLKSPTTSVATPSKLKFSSSSSTSISPQVSWSKLKSSRSSKNPWAVYLILSTNSPIKTYVGVTTNFFRRLKQHNGELKGGAKASRAGRPWVCACLINGFSDKSEAGNCFGSWNKGWTSSDVDSAEVCRQMTNTVPPLRTSWEIAFSEAS